MYVEIHIPYQREGLFTPTAVCNSQAAGTDVSVVGCQQTVQAKGLHYDFSTSFLVERVSVEVTLKTI